MNAPTQFSFVRTCLSTPRKMRSELGCCDHGIGDDEKELQRFSEALKASLDANAMPGSGLQVSGGAGGRAKARRRHLFLEMVAESRSHSQMGNPGLAASFQMQTDLAAADVEKGRAAVR
jgi:hypothetical protein